MEHFTIVLPSRLAPSAGAQEPDAAPEPGHAVLCGVVSSGNLEVLVEAAPPPAAPVCCFEIHTAATGFRDTWEAVLQDFARHHTAGGLQFLLNDVGATPAVVALRLAQAFERWQERAAGPAA